MQCPWQKWPPTFCSFHPNTISIYTLTPINTSFSIFCPPQWFATRRRPVLRPSGAVAAHFCVYDSIVRSTTEHCGKEPQTMYHKTWPSGRGGGLWTPQTNQMQAHKVRFGRGKGASHTCCATNGALSGDCWQRQLCPSGAKLDVTKTQLNLWDIQIVISMFLYLKCFFSNKKALFFNSASHISIY